MHLHKIVLTGGPCGGKTTALAKITDYFESRGFIVVRVPEAATMLISGGVSPAALDPIDFQAELLKIQRQLEDSFAGLATTLMQRQLNSPKSARDSAIVLCDRGTMDNLAYMGDVVWQAVLDANNWSLVELRDRRYSAVVHLTTAAIGAEAAYSRANNAARTETAEQARDLDARTMKAWIGHPHLRVIDNSTDFDTKILRAIRAICRVVGIPEPIEDERKYLVRSVDEIPVPYQDVDIEQTYLNAEGERVRRRGQRGVNVYFHTIKKALGGSRRTEIERQITPREYVELLQQRDPGLVTIHKTRRCFLWEGQYFELDMFRCPFPNLVLLEAELDEGQTHVPLPPFVHIERDVTEEKDYTNRALARAKGSVSVAGRP